MSDDLMVGRRRRRRRAARIVDQDEFAEVELVGESFPFGLVQDAFVVVVSVSTVCSVSGCVCVGGALSECGW